MSRSIQTRTPALLAFAALVSATAASLGCATGQSTTPRSRVAQDLGCTTEGTSVQEIAPVPGERAARWQVRGCGKTAVYLCTQPVRDCWREGSVQPNGAAPVAAVP